MKKFFKILLLILLVLVLIVACGLLYLTAVEYKPSDTETLTVNGTAENALAVGDSFHVLTWNIGYCGLGAGSDFVMDGGSNVRSADEATVNAYLEGIYKTVYEDSDNDIIMLQEVDTNSTRTYGINESETLASGSNTFAYNFKAVFVPYPVPPIGRVSSGLLTCSDYTIESAQRDSLPCPFKWPIRICNLKRCLSVNYIPVEGSDHYLVMINLHLEAYDDGDGKIAQTNMLRQVMEEEYAKGNYVIAGGDFNQVFPDTLEVYPNTHEENWTPGMLDSSMIPEGWNYAYDTSAPTCRLLNQPLDPEDTENTQYYVIDGYIVSPNVTVENVQTLDVGFANSDHNPVQLQVSLK